MDKEESTCVEGFNHVKKIPKPRFNETWGKWCRMFVYETRTFARIWTAFSISESETVSGGRMRRT
jgi:hypothetical protein